MDKKEALKKLDEIFDPAIERCKQDAKTNQSQKTKIVKIKK